MARPLLLVIGAGPGIGSAVAHRYGRSGYDVALLARSPDRLEALGRSLQAVDVTAGWFPADVTDAQRLTEAVTRFGSYTGRIDVLFFNPVAFRAEDALTLTPDGLLDDLRTGVASLLTAVQAARPFMSPGARIIATGGGAADTPSAGAASLGVQKAALRNLVASFDQTLSPSGIRAASVTISSRVAPGTATSAELVAEVIFQLGTTAPDPWQTEVGFEPGSSTQTRD